MNAYAIQLFKPNTLYKAWFSHDWFTGEQKLIHGASLWAENAQGVLFSRGTMFKTARAVRARLRDARRLAKSEGFIVPPRIRIWRLDHHGNPASLLPLRPPKAKPKRKLRQKPRLRHS